MDKCKVEGCNNKGKLGKKGKRYFPRGFCNSHYKKWNKYNRDIVEENKKPVLSCCVEDCDNPPPYKKGMCGKHYRRFKLYGDVNFTQYINGGQTKHYLYNTYGGIKKRCYDNNDKDYKRYGEKGIKMCDRWLGAEGFFNFIEDMGDRPTGYTLDRIDCKLGYSKENCRWADIHTQAINKINSGRGVNFIKETGKYRSRLTINGQQIEIGSFDKKEDAIQARIEAEIKYIGKKITL